VELKLELGDGEEMIYPAYLRFSSLPHLERCNALIPVVRTLHNEVPDSLVPRRYDFFLPQHHFVLNTTSNLIPLLY
jgi:hypothetical protein